MATIRADSELMTNLVSAIPVPGGSYFRVILDEHRRPAVISISNTSPPKLQLICHSAGEASGILDIGQHCLSIPPDARVSTFDVQQAANLSICLCVGIIRNDNTSGLVIAQPFFPGALLQKKQLPLVDGNDDIGKIERIWMTPIAAEDTDDAESLPRIYVTHKTLDQATSWGSDITRIDIAANGYEWHSARSEQTPENTARIIDIAPAVSDRYGKGLFVLYESDGASQLYARFLRPDLDENDGTMKSFVTPIKCAPDARCIAAVVVRTNIGAASSLLVASSEGIRHLSPSHIVQGKGKESGTLITQHEDLLRDVHGLEVAQDGEFCTAWFTNRSGELGYVRAQDGDFEHGQSALVLPASQVSSFAVCVAQPSETNGNLAWQMLVSNDRHGNLKLLQQASDTGLWRPEPFYVPSNTENFEIESYTITIRVQTDDGMPMVSGKVFITAASAVEATLNGLSCNLVPDGDWYNMDDSGSLDFIVPTHSLGAHSLTISKVKDDEGKSVATKPLVFDPSQKPMEKMYSKLASFESAEALGRAKTEAGEALFQDPPDQKQLKEALDCFKTLRTAYRDAPRNGTSVLSQGAKTAEAVTVAISTNASGFLMDKWYWLREKVGDAVKFGLEAVGKAWRFVCELGGKVWNFVLDCAEKISEAATWVWEKIKVGWQKLKDFVGFVFNWSDIKDTKNTISQLITAGIGAASDKVGDVERKVDGFFNSLKDKIDDFGAVGPRVSAKQESGASDSDLSGSGTGASWAQERLKNGGATSSTQVDKGDNNTEAVTTWSSVFQPALAKLEGEIAKVSADIAKLFKKEGSIDGKDIVDVSKGVLKVALEVIRGLVTSLLRLVQKLCGEVIKIGNKAIKIPVFSALWKKISGSELSLFDAISLIIAIPTTIIAKLATGEKPPQIPGLDRTLVKRIVEGDESVDKDSMHKFDILKAEIALALVVNKGIWNLIKIGYKAAKEGLGGVLKATDKGPSTFFDMMGIVFDMFGYMAALPTERGLPGGEFRNWISSISFYRGCCNLVVFMAGGGAVAEKALLVMDVVTTLAQFGLYMAVYDAEYKAVSWEDYDVAKTTVSVTECVLNTVSGVGYSTAAYFKMKQPKVSGVGLIVMQAGLVGLTAVEAAKFKVQFDQKKRTRFAAPAC